MNSSPPNVDPAELAKFSTVASSWWDPGSTFKPLHDINPLRLDFIDSHAPLYQRHVLDVGCGGGILSESMALRGAQVTGIDLAEKSLQVARLHLLESGLAVDYRLISAEDLALAQPASFDIVTCMEMLEHVPDPASVVAACGHLLRPGGKVVFSTFSRNPKAYLQAVLGAEYLLGLLPRGTHDYARFIKPSELARMARSAGLSPLAICGMGYHWASKTYHLTPQADVSYLLVCERNAS